MPNTAPNHHCRIWQDSLATRVTRIPFNDAIKVTNSPRAAGSYNIDIEADEWLQDNDDLDAFHLRARLTTWLIQQRTHTDAPWVTYELIEQMINTPDLLPTARCRRLLHKLSTYPNQHADVTPESEAHLELLAHSESIDERELFHVITKLEYDGLLLFDGWNATVTEAGKQHLQEPEKHPRINISF